MCTAVKHSYINHGRSLLTCENRSGRTWWPSPSGDMLKGGGRGQNRQRVSEGLEPPYEQMFDHQQPSGGSSHGVPPGFEMSVKGKGHGDHGQHQDASLPRPWQALNQGTGSAMLNGTERLDSGAGISELQGNPRVQGEARRERQSGWDMELLIHQLLQQNSALQRELSEVRLGSASGSNVSGEGRTEGRGSRRSSGSGSEANKRGKGQGLEEFTPPWTTFAGMHSDSQTSALSGQLVPWTMDRACNAQQ